MLLRSLATAIIVLLCCPAQVWAMEAPLESTDHRGWSGYAGLGPAVFQKYTGGTRTRSLPMPIVSASYNDIVYLEPFRAGAYFWSNADKTLGLSLAAEPRFGYSPHDGTRLTGMARRKRSVEAGPSIDWNFGIAALSVSAFSDLGGTTRGRSERLYVIKEYQNGPDWKGSAFVGLDRLGARVANYYFGVTPEEVTPYRPQYEPGSATTVTLGCEGSYRLSASYSAVFGLQLTRLNRRITQSPIVEIGHSGIFWAGFAWNL